MAGMDEQQPDNQPCKYCGRPIPSGAPFCYYCGRELIARPERPMQTEKNHWPLWLTLIGVFGGAAVILFVVFQLLH